MDIPNWNLECWFLWRKENWKDPEKNSLSKEKNQQETQPTCDAILGHSSGRRVLSPLHHSLSPSLASFVYFQFFPDIFVQLGLEIAEKLWGSRLQGQCQ